MVSGIVIMVILSLIDYSFILRFSWIIYLLAVEMCIRDRFKRERDVIWLDKQAFGYDDAAILTDRCV